MTIHGPLPANTSGRSAEWALHRRSRGRDPQRKRPSSPCDRETAVMPRRWPPSCGTVVCPRTRRRRPSGTSCEAFIPARSPHDAGRRERWRGTKGNDLSVYTRPITRRSQTGGFRPVYRKNPTKSTLSTCLIIMGSGVRVPPPTTFLQTYPVIAEKPLQVRVSEVSLADPARRIAPALGVVPGVLVDCLQRASLDMPLADATI